MEDPNYDELLNIETEGNQRGYNKSFHYHRYEPTPYSALEKLFEEYELTSSDHIVDFGCGKGRLNFFIHHLFQASVTGIEMSEKLYDGEQSELFDKSQKKRRDSISMLLGRKI
jgi:cyclopropane fatty-acyl-phospholipid synthase-like methyltransferase